MLTRGETVLLTGFEPWDAHKVNPSREFVTADPKFDGWVVHKKVLPVSDACFEIFSSALERFDPHVIVSLGLAANRQTLAIEKRARKTVKMTSGPEILTSDLVPPGFDHSDDAGDFYCNALFYYGLRICRETSRRMAFVHLPHNVNMAEVHKAVTAILEQRSRTAG